MITKCLRGGGGGGGLFGNRCKLGRVRFVEVYGTATDHWGRSF